MDDSTSLDPGVIRWVLLGVALLAAAGAGAFFVLKPGPVSVADDPLLSAGRAVYRTRCISCHGESGRGDGPISSTLKGPPPGNLTDDQWKHGGRPDQVLAVVAQGVPDTAMSGWARYLEPGEVRAVTAYVFHLAGRPVPDELRKPEAPGR